MQDLSLVCSSPWVIVEDMHHPGDGIISFHSGVRRRLISRRHLILLSLQLSWLPSFRLTRGIALGDLMEKTQEILHCCNFFLTDCEIPAFLYLPWKVFSTSGSHLSQSTTRSKGWDLAERTAVEGDGKMSKRQKKVGENRNTWLQKRDVMMRIRKCRLQERKWGEGWEKSKRSEKKWKLNLHFPFYQAVEHKLGKIRISVSYSKEDLQRSLLQCCRNWLPFVPRSLSPTDNHILKTKWYPCTFACLT